MLGFSDSDPVQGYCKENSYNPYRIYFFLNAWIPLGVVFSGTLYKEFMRLIQQNDLRNVFFRKQVKATIYIVHKHKY